MTTHRRLRVLHVVGGLGLGGGQKLAALVASGLDREAFAVTVLNLGKPGVYGDRLRAAAIPVLDLGMPLRPGVTDLPAVLSGLVRLVRTLLSRPRWDIVHTHLFVTAVLCAIPSRLAGSRLFGTVHRIYYPGQAVVERLLAPLHEAIVVDSRAVGRILQAATRIRPDRYVVIHNGIDTEELDAAPDRATARERLGLSPASTVVTEVAHLEPHKGQHHLVVAFARVSRESDHLLLVGDGPTRASLEQQCRDLGIEGRVTFTGARPDLPVVLAASDILTLPSTFEGFGIVQAEAMYLRIPVISTDRGGATEVVVDGSTGFLVPFGDEDALAGRLERLLQSPSMRREMGDAGRNRVMARFTQARMVRRYADLYAGRLTKGLEAAAGDP